MASTKRNCDYCKQEYSTKLVKVYVFKERKCPKCETRMFADNNKRTLKCRKCKHVVSMDDDVQLGKMKVRIRGTSRDFKVKRQMMREGIEVDKKMIPKTHYCQRCRNLRTHMLNSIKNRKLKSKARELPIKDVQRMIRHQVIRQLQKEQQIKKMEEATPPPEPKKPKKKEGDKTNGK
jgi:hypothetical protein